MRSTLAKHKHYLRCRLSFHKWLVVPKSVTMCLGHQYSYRVRCSRCFIERIEYFDSYEEVR